MIQRYYHYLFKYLYEYPYLELNLKWVLPNSSPVFVFIFSFLLLNPIVFCLLVNETVTLLRMNE